MHADVTERIRIVRRLDFTQSERIQYTYEEHGAILRAILARKPQQATLLLRSHIEQSKLEVRKISIHRLHMAHLEAPRRG
jgi:DNA-binding GntR family transcriptional regulator